MKDFKFQIDLGYNVYKEIDRVSESLNISKAELLRRAIKLFIFVVDTKIDTLISEDGSEHKVVGAGK